jgi:hypothetical protein
MLRGRTALAMIGIPNSHHCPLLKAAGFLTGPSPFSEPWFASAVSFRPYIVSLAHADNGTSSI